MKIPRRINVVGTSAVGKSTVSKRLSNLLSIPHLEMDALFWGPDWYWPDDAEFFSKLTSALSGDEWILDGNYTRTISIKWERVETVVWLDYSFVRTCFQSVTRAFYRALTQQELWEGTGNRESFRKSFFNRDSIILWAVMNHGRNRRKYEKTMLDPEFSSIEFVRLRSPAEAEKYLQLLAGRLGQSAPLIF